MARRIPWADLAVNARMNPLNDNLKDFLNLATYPARLTKEQTAAYLGFEPDQITVLIKSKLLKLLGRPAPCGEKFFARFELDKLKNDREWLSKATLAVTDYWKDKNARKSKAANQPPKSNEPRRERGLARRRQAKTHSPRQPALTAAPLVSLTSGHACCALG